MAGLGVQHFEELFTTLVGPFLAKIVHVAQHFPGFVDDNDNRRLMEAVTNNELLKILHSFKKDKSPGLDGWPLEFFIGFFDLIGADMLKVVEEYRLDGHVHGPIKCTFIALIPQKDQPKFFDDFRPISLCN